MAYSTKNCKSKKVEVLFHNVLYYTYYQNMACNTYLNTSITGVYSLCWIFNKVCYMLSTTRLQIPTYVYTEIIQNTKLEGPQICSLACISLFSSTLNHIILNLSFKNKQVPLSTNKNILSVTACYFVVRIYISLLFPSEATSL